jgi:acyl carrier protein
MTQSTNKLGEGISPMQQPQTMNPTDTEREIRSFLVENFLLGRPEAWHEDMALLGNVIDSTGAIELIMFLQNRFAITVDDAELIPKNFDTLQSVVNYVERKVHGNP